MRDGTAPKSVQSPRQSTAHGQSGNCVHASLLCFAGLAEVLDLQAEVVSRAFLRAARWVAWTVFPRTTLATAWALDKDRVGRAIVMAKSRASWT